MKSLYILVFASFCCAFGQQSRGYQPWTVDPRNSLYPSLPNVAPDSENEACRTHSRMFLDALRTKKLWAMRMWDSTAKAPVGILSGSIFHYGNFDGCLKIAAPFKVRYCLGHVFANVSLRFYDFRETNESLNVWTYLAKSRMTPSKIPRNVLGWGLCVPDSCKASEIQNTVNSHLLAFGQMYNNETAFIINIDDSYCTNADDFLEMTSGEIAFWAVLFTLIILTISSTLVDLISNYEQNKPSKIYNIWMFFSIKQNYSRLIPIGTREKSTLSVFHGIKFFSILNIIFGHRIGISLSLSALNYDDIEDFFIKEHKMFFFQSDLVVDTFFFISGLLACYFMMEIFSKEFINPLHAICARIFRLAPIYFFLLWYQGTAAFRLGSGPMWKALAKNETEYCAQYWWTNVLFVNNYVHTRKMCMVHSWFLSCEIHFFIAAVILVQILVKNRKLGQIVLGLVIAGFIITPGVVIYVNKILPLILFYYEFIAMPRKNASFNLLYIKSHNRAAVYFIGMAAGLFLYHSRDWKSKISMKLTLCGVLGWFAFMFAPMAYGALYYDPNKIYNVIEASIFGSLRRVSWAIAFSIFIITHRFGTIPIIDYLFSSRLAIFLSRITYGIYLVHFTLVTSSVISNRIQTRFSVHELLIRGIGDILESGTITVIIFFILEIPLKRLFREFVFAKKVKKLERPPEVQNIFTVRL